MDLSLKCQSVTLSPTGVVAVEGECLLGPIHQGATFVAVMRDDAVVAEVSLTAKKVEPWRGGRDVLDRWSKGTVSLAGEGADLLKPGDVLVSSLAP